LALLTSIRLYAQATATGTILGVISDPMHAVITEAKVTAIQTTTGISRTATTGNSGAYTLEGLAPGYYTVKVVKNGFTTGNSKLELLVGQSATVNFTLKPGSVDEVVEVTAESVLLDVSKTSVSQNITPSEVEEMPLIGRDAANLAYLAPGVKMADSFDPTKNRSAVLSVNGNIGREVNVTINGVDNKDNSVGGTVMQLPLEGVQEFIISTQRFSAANGRSEGAAINMITKQGSNQLHGSVFSYFREQQFNANQTSPDGTKNPIAASSSADRPAAPLSKTSSSASLPMNVSARIRASPSRALPTPSWPPCRVPVCSVPWPLRVCPRRSGRTATTAVSTTRSTTSTPFI
jgi:hypothetical protein